MTKDLGGFRIKKQKLLKGAQRGASSSQWLERQLNDPYVALAKQKGYRSRAAFKIVEIHESHKIFKPGYVVVDLGAAPGGWSQIAAGIVKPQEAGGRVIAMDLLEIRPIPDVDFIQGDFMDEEAFAKLNELLEGKEVNVVLSDMAPNTSGHRNTDHLRIIGLAEAALDFACKVLVPGGSFVTKLFQGSGDKAYLDEVRKHFEKGYFVKPKSSRSDSSEMYVVGKNFKG